MRSRKQASGMKVRRVEFIGWKDCIELKNGDFRVIVTTQVGPRIIGGFVGQSETNLFRVDPELAGKTGSAKWVNYGGHRLWHSPETRERTYEPDNSPIQVVTEDDGSVSFIMVESEKTGIRKTINIAPWEKFGFRIDHILSNDGVWPIEAAPWGISVMAPGGVAVIPQNVDETEGLLPTKFYSVWPYTKMNDPRIEWGENFVLVHQKDGKNVKPMKIGLHSLDGWVAYINNGIAFVKAVPEVEPDGYPDNNCSIEVYTCREMLEAETLGPLELLEPGDEVVHTELWQAVPVSGPVKSEKDVEKILTEAFGDCGCEDCK